MKIKKEARAKKSRAIKAMALTQIFCLMLETFAFCFIFSMSLGMVSGATTAGQITVNGLNYKIDSTGTLFIEGNWWQSLWGHSWVAVDTESSSYNLLYNQVQKSLIPETPAPVIEADISKGLTDIVTGNSPSAAAQPLPTDNVNVNKVTQVTGNLPSETTQPVPPPADVSEEALAVSAAQAAATDVSSTPLVTGSEGGIIDIPAEETIDIEPPVTETNNVVIDSGDKLNLGGSNTPSPFGGDIN